MICLCEKINHSTFTHKSRNFSSYFLPAHRQAITFFLPSLTVSHCPNNLLPGSDLLKQSGCSLWHWYVTRLLWISVFFTQQSSLDGWRLILCKTEPLAASICVAFQGDLVELSSFSFRPCGEQLFSWRRQQTAVTKIATLWKKWNAPLSVSPWTGVGFYFESAGGRGNILIVTELFYQICFVKLKMFLWKDLSHFFSLASLTKCRHESA